MFADLALADSAEERKKRELKAASAECTPISIDADAKLGTFSGSSGAYRTFLSECECVDFRRRKHPCKHMYRLAFELGQYVLGDVVSDSSKIKRKITPQERTDSYEQCVALIETYPEETQKKLQSIIGSYNGGSPSICSDVSVVKGPLSDGLLETVLSPVTIIEAFSQKRTIEAMLAAGFTFPADLKPTKKAKYEWCLSHADIACAYAYPEYFTVRPCGILSVASRKVYTYLNRKFEALNEVEW